MRRRASQAGFTLLEVLVATVILGVAVAALMGNLTQSMGNVARVTGHDRGVLLAQQKMDELVAATRLPRNQVMEGIFNPQTTGGMEAGWRATSVLLDLPPGAGPGVTAMDRVDLLVWWKIDGKSFNTSLEGVKRNILTPGDMERLPR